MMKRLLFLLLAAVLTLQLRAADNVNHDERLFARIITDRETIYAGDSMLVSVVIYATSPIAKAECATDFTIKGKCATRKLDINRDATASRTREGRNIYYTLVWNQYVVAPTQTGKMTIPTQKFKATLQRIVSMPDIFDQMMGVQPEYKEIKVQGCSEPFTFEVTEKPRRSTQEMMRNRGGVL